MNFDQPYAHHFEKGRMKLKKLLMFEPFVMNEIQVTNNKYNIKKNKPVKNAKNNIYELNPNKNTINTYYDNNEYMFMDLGDKTNKTKKTIKYPKKEKIEFIPLEVKKRNNVHSMEKLKVSKNMKMNSNMNNTRNRRNKDVDDNNIYINEQISNYNRRQNQNTDEIKKYNNVINKFKKTKMSSSMDKQYMNDRYNNNPFGHNTKYKNKINYFEDDENE